MPARRLSKRQPQSSLFGYSKPEFKSSRWRSARRALHHALTVAASTDAPRRAKRKIVLFSSLNPEDIVVDQEKTAPGVRVLRDYLLYARDGRIERGNTSHDEAENAFESSVANALRACGYNVALQVGVAGYRIDLAIRHPAMPSRFVLGIECDGVTYHSAKSARDRDRLRQQALEQLGWRLARVWSTDWFRDPAGQVKRLSVEIEHAIQAYQSKDSEDGRLVNLPRNVGPATPAAVAKPMEMRGSRASSPELPLARPNELPLQRAEPAAAPSTEQASPDLAQLLRQFRDQVIMSELPGSEPNRSILREQMIRMIVESGLDDPDDFHAKIPEWLRVGTDGRQMRYLDRICEIVADPSAGIRSAHWPEP